MEAESGTERGEGRSPGETAWTKAPGCGRRDAGGGGRQGAGRVAEEAFPSTRPPTKGHLLPREKARQGFVWRGLARRCWGGGGQCEGSRGVCVQMGLAPGWGGHSQKRRAGKGAGAEGQVLLAAHWLRNLAQTRDGRLRAKWPRGSCLWRGRGPEAQGEAQSEELLLPGSTRPAPLQSSCRWPRWETPAQGCGVGLPRGPRRGVHGRDHGHMSGRFLCTGPTVWRGLWLPGTAHDLRAMPAPDSVGASRRRPPSVLCPPCCQGPVWVTPPPADMSGWAVASSGAQPSPPATADSAPPHTGSAEPREPPAPPPRRSKTSVTGIPEPQVHRNRPLFPGRGEPRERDVCMCVCGVCACACVRAFVHACVCMHVHARVFVCMCAHVCMCLACMCTCVCMCLPVPVSVCIHMHACVHM